MTTGKIVGICILVIAMWTIGYICGRVEEREKNGSVAKKLDISRLVSSDNTSMEVERKQDN